MLIRTHLAITIFAILFFISSVNNKLVFVAVALIATFLPDADTGFSSLGKKKIMKPIQIFVRHRGFLHSLTFLFLLTVIFITYTPTIALAFFLGYFLHIFADSFTMEGIKPFYPFSKMLNGKLKTGGKKEVTIFVFFILADLTFFGIKVITLM